MDASADPAAGREDRPAAEAPVVMMYRWMLVPADVGGVPPAAGIDGDRDKAMRTAAGMLAREDSALLALVQGVRAVPTLEWPGLAHVAAGPWWTGVRGRRGTVKWTAHAAPARAKQ